MIPGIRLKLLSISITKMNSQTYDDPQKYFSVQSIEKGTAINQNYDTVQWLKLNVHSTPEMDGQT